MGGQIHVEIHPEKTKQAPDPDLIGHDVPHPFAPARADSRVDFENLSHVRELDLVSATALGIAPTFAPMPNPLSRTQFVTVKFPSPPEPAVAASAPINPQSMGRGTPEN